jgi:phosphoribosylformylglycinamidine (FGAM) synthase-like amidotransferase family enzyme
MKLLIPFLMAMLLVASIAQSQSAAVLGICNGKQAIDLVTMQQHVVACYSEEQIF